VYDSVSAGTSSISCIAIDDAREERPPFGDLCFPFGDRGERGGSFGFPDFLGDFGRTNEKAWLKRFSGLLCTVTREERRAL
jgi:hypothetical protein